MYGVNDPNFQEFYRGLREAQEVILKIKPDILVVPLRGAKPLHDFIQRLSAEDGRSSDMPEFIEVPLGEVSSSTGVKVGITADDTSTKVEVLRQHLIPCLKEKGVEKPVVCILDEVGSGGALLKNMGYAKEVLAEGYPNSLVVAVAVGDSNKRRQPFTHLRAKGFIHEIRLDDKYSHTSMLTMDRPELLVTLVRGEDGKVKVADEGEPIESARMGDALVALHRQSNLTPEISKSKLLKRLVKWRHGSIGISTPSRLREIMAGVWVSGIPRNQQQVEALKEMGFDTVISFEPLSRTMKKRFTDEKIQVIDLPIPDDGVPSRADTQLFLQIMQQERQAGKKTLLHCQNGVGRACTMATLHLLQTGTELKDIPAQNISKTSKSQREFLIQFAQEKKMREHMDVSTQQLEQDLRTQIRHKLQQKTR